MAIINGVHQHAKQQLGWVVAGTVDAGFANLIVLSWLIGRSFLSTLLSLRDKITVKKLMDFLHKADIKEKYGIEHNISHKTACRYLHALGYHYRSTPQGQYVDGHEREDVTTYRKKVFLPKWKKFMNHMATWDKDLREYPPSGEGKHIIATKMPVLNFT